MRKNIIRTKEKKKPSVLREYDIGGTKYIVKATVRTGASENAAAIVRRLIHNDLSKKNTK